jgi:hypothetical protein
LREGKEVIPKILDTALKWADSASNWKLLNLMKARIKNLFLLPVLIAALGLIPAGRVTAQTFTNLHNFTFGSDGVAPQGDAFDHCIAMAIQ